MTWTAPRPVLNVALSNGPNDVLTGPDWTDLSDRIIGDIEWTVDVGRDSPLDVFQPGQLTVVLDNTDRMLDPSNPTGLVYAADGLGLPMSPVTFDLDYGGSTVRRFTGYLGLNCWEGSGTTRVAGSVRKKTTTLTALDRLAYSGDLPSEPWHALILEMYPDWWLPMDAPFPVLVNNSPVPNRAPGGGEAKVYVPSGTDLTRVSGEFNKFQPNLKFSPTHELISAAADIMPTGDCLNLTVCMWWQLSTPHSTGEESVVLRMVAPGGGNTRWEIIVDDAGEAQVSTYNAGGTLVDSDTIDRTGTGVSRWDDGNAHLVIVRFTSGNVLDVWFGGAGPTGGTMAATSTVYESDLHVGPSDQSPVVDELALWRSSLSDEQIAGMVLSANVGGFLPWLGDNWRGDNMRVSRIERWYNTAGITIDGGFPSQWHVPYDNDDVGFMGVISVPDTFAEALRQTVGPNGAVYVLADGSYRIRTIEALTDSAYAADYVTPIAEFTDDPGSLTSGQVRHSGVELSGVDASTVANRAEIVFRHVISLGPPVNAVPMSLNPESTTTVGGKTSIERFGKRTRSEFLEWYGYERAGELALAIIDRYAWPVPGIDQVTIDATGNDDATTLLISDVELEKAIDVTYTPPTADGSPGTPVTVEGLNIQAFRLSGTSTTFTAALRAARS